MKVKIINNYNNTDSIFKISRGDYFFLKDDEDGELYFCIEKYPALGDNPDGARVINMKTGYCREFCRNVKIIRPNEVIIEVR